MRFFNRLKRWVAPVWRPLRELRKSRGEARSVVVELRKRPPHATLSVTRELYMLAWPVAAATFGETAMGLVDTKLVGGLGAAQLGGVGIAATLMYLAYKFSLGLMRGVKVRTAYAIGRGTPDDAILYASAGLLLSGLVGVFVWLVGRDITWALDALSIDARLVPHARVFFAAVSCGAPAACMLSALVNYRQGRGDSRTPMFVGFATNIVNGFLAYGLIFGHWGLPAWGVAGAGYATAFAEAFGLSLMLALFVRDATRAHTSTRIGFRAAVGEVLSLGFPTGTHFVAEMLAFTAFTAILGSLPPAELAAHQIALVTLRVSFLPGDAIAEATSVLVAQALSQSRLRKAEQIARAGIGMACAFMMFCAVIFVLFGGAIVGAFTTSADVTTIAKKLVLLAAAFQFCDAVNLVLRGALRGAKDARIPAIVGTAIVWSCVPMAAWALGKQFGLGAFGAWIGFLFETTIAATFFWHRWTRGPWRKKFLT